MVACVLSWFVYCLLGVIGRLRSVIVALPRRLLYCFCVFGVRTHGRAVIAQQANYSPLLISRKSWCLSYLCLAGIVCQIINQSQWIIKRSFLSELHILQRLWWLRQLWLLTRRTTWAALWENGFPDSPWKRSFSAHTQAICLAICLRFPLGLPLAWANSKGSGETARMRRLACTFAVHIFYKGCFPMPRLA